jgi:hypothetical protein
MMMMSLTRARAGPRQAKKTHAARQSDVGHCDFDHSADTGLTKREHDL